MNAIIQNISQRQVILLACYAIIFSLVYSPFVLSVGMFLLLWTTLMDVNVFFQSFKFRLHPKLKANFQEFIQSPVFLVLTIFFFLVLLGGLYTEDFDYWLRRLKMKLPFLVLPFIFVSLPAFSKRDYLSFYYFLVTILFVTCIGVGINYLLYTDVMIDHIERGRSIPVPRNHIRFSLLMAIGIVAGAYLYYQKFTLKYDWERPLILFMTGFLLFFIHVLSVRSGLLVLYLSLAVLALIFTYQTRRYWIGILGIALVIGLPIIAYQAIPSFKSKVNYVRYDLFMQQNDITKNFSDAERIISLQLGWAIAKENPIIGVGSGDLKMKMKQAYLDNELPTDEIKMPHNQLLSVFASNGIIGLVAFLFAFFFPLFYKKNYRHPLFLALHIIIFFSFMMENTIENSMGLGIYIFWLLLGLNYLEGRRRN